MSDKQIFTIYHDLFGRRAFKAPFMEETRRVGLIVDNFHKAIEDTIKEISHPDMKENISRSSIKNKNYRKKVDYVYNQLLFIDNILKTYKEQPKNIFANMEDINKIDIARDKIINALNEVWAQIRLQPLPIPTTVNINELSMK
jgi:hypothetical protein